MKVVTLQFKCDKQLVRKVYPAVMGSSVECQTVGRGRAQHKLAHLL